MNLFVLGVFLALACGIEGGLLPPHVIASLAGTSKPRSTDIQAPILRADSVINSGGYQYGYETGNGISAESSAVLKNVDSSNVYSVQGHYRYISPDGTPVEVRYVADENGYRIVQ